MTIINILIFSSLEVRTGLRRAQSVKCLPSKYKDLNSNPRTCVKMPSMILCTCNPTAGEVEAEDHMTLASQLVQLVQPYHQ